MALAEWTVLVLLSQRPAHGFAVAQLTAPDGELGRIWRIPRPVVYRAIGRLLDAGLITPESVEPGLGPQRTIYTVTARGRFVTDHTPYALFYRYVPGFDGLRVPARYAAIVTLGLAALGAFAKRVDAYFGR